ncbi:MAG: hypothetical protein A2W00_09105 [Candidatus Eisenbacteria bacterium RBG_16_71_46]|nr:MAG: hypothetical protein A2W00_09105 [Candidatus Eisenbacteria bacterium RBG_16_71_46]OGF24677.1 MAG: hypothetical protein A2V63_07690 [Candidatus Eisenbacteria bacterium RBG_19FT_COMBO_70_11]
MAVTVRRVEYFYATIRGEPDEAYKLLEQLAAQQVNLLALNTMPMGPESTQLTLFPEDPMRLQNAAKAAQLPLEGPHVAVFVQGEDELGAIARLHTRLQQAGVHVFASTAVVDGRGYFGYILYMRPQDTDRTLAMLRA